MKILFLGTGAADYLPETDYGTEGYRRNSSALINERILIDPGPCVPEAIKTFGVDIKKIKYVISTHSHRDHFNKDTLALLQENGAVFVKFNDGETKEFEGHCITALKGNHSIDVQHFIINDGKSKLFYALDSAWLMYEEIQAVKEVGIDYAVLDGTIGFIDGDYRVFEHCNLNMIIEMQKSLKEHIKCFCISHLAKTLHPEHSAVCDSLKPYGIEVAYDGYEKEF